MGRILVVDDKELMRDSVAAILSRKGHMVSRRLMPALRSRAFPTSGRSAWSPTCRCRA